MPCSQMLKVFSYPTKMSRSTDNISNQGQNYETQPVTLNIEYVTDTDNLPIDALTKTHISSVFVVATLIVKLIFAS